MSFTLESGKSELEMDFQHVELHRCEQGVLRVTEAEPLAAYITSIGSPDEGTRAKLLEYLRGIISVEGILSIHTKNGIFVARK